MKQIFNSCNFYLLVCVLLVFSGGTMYVILQTILILWSLYYVIYANFHYKLPVYFKALNVLLIVFSIYGFLLVMKGEQLYVQVSMREVSNMGYLKEIYKSLLPIYAFYVFAKKGLLTERAMKFWFFVFLVITIRSFYHNQARLLRKAFERGSSAEEFTNNVAYNFVALLPALVLFHKKPIVQYVLLAICGYFILLGMKRGAMLSGALCLGWFLFANVRKAPRKRRWIIVVVSALVIVAGIYYVQYRINTSSYFQYRIEQTQAGESSQRDILYLTFYQHFINEENPFLFVFGNGANATLKFGENFAHNDWLEIAINQGVLGLVVYLVYWICFFVTWRKTRKQPQAFMAIGMLLIIYFITTWFSMSYNSVARCAAMVLGFYLAAIGQKEEVLVPATENPEQCPASFVS